MDNNEDAMRSHEVQRKGCREYSKEQIVTPHLCRDFCKENIMQAFSCAATMQAFGCAATMQAFGCAATTHAAVRPNLATNENVTLTLRFQLVTCYVLAQQT